MGASAKPWTKAIEDFLLDGEWRDTEEALRAGAAAVPEERALHEMGDRQSSQPTERRIKIGQRNVAQQAVTGMIRFGKAEYGEGRKKIRRVGDKSRSLGELATKVDELEQKLTAALDLVETYESRIEFLERKATGEIEPSEQLLVAAGLPANV